MLLCFTTSVRYSYVLPTGRKVLRKSNIKELKPYPFFRVGLSSFSTEVGAALQICRQIRGRSTSYEYSTSSSTSHFQCSPCCTTEVVIVRVEHYDCHGTAKINVLPLPVSSNVLQPRFPLRPSFCDVPCSNLPSPRIRFSFQRTRKDYQQRPHIKIF